MATAITIRGRYNPRTGEAGGSFGSGIDGEGDGLLAEGHYISKKMPMYKIYPRDDSETQSHARHRKYHSGFPYEIPLGIQGGAWPFFYQFLVAPVGATIGSTIIENNYGVIRWAPSGETTPQRFTVQVVDQDGDKITLSWTAVLDDAGFVFIDSNAVVSGLGTIASPLKLFDDWYKHNVNDATYVNKIAVFRGGSYSVAGDTSNGNVLFSLAAKTPSLIGHPDETAILDCSTATFFTTVLIHDLYVSHLTFMNGRSADVPNAHFWWLTTVPNRVSFFKVVFDTITKGTVGTDNPSCIFVGDPGQKLHYLIKNCTFQNVNNSLSNGSYFDWYDVKYGLVEGNVAKNSIVDFGFWFKATISHITFRGNRAVENVQGTQLSFGYSDVSSVSASWHEACYDSFVVPVGQSTRAVVEMVGDSDDSAFTHDTYLYRCSMVGGNTWIRFTMVDTDANIVLTNNLPRWQLADQVTTVANDVRTSAVDFVDTTTGLLIGTARSTHLGLKGAEIE